MGSDEQLNLHRQEEIALVFEARCSVCVSVSVGQMRRSRKKERERGVPGKYVRHPSCSLVLENNLLDFPLISWNSLVVILLT